MWGDSAYAGLRAVIRNHAPRAQDFTNPKGHALALEQGRILRARGDELTICPPLIMTDAEVDSLFNVLIMALDQLAGEMRVNR